MYMHWIAGAGPALGAATVWFIYRYSTRLSLGGTNAALAWSMVAVPALLTGGMGIPNVFGVEPHLFGLHMDVCIVVYALLEEASWRGYLKDEFRNRPPF